MGLVFAAVEGLSLDPQGQVKLEAAPVSCGQVTGGRLESKCQPAHIHSGE